MSSKSISINFELYRYKVCAFFSETQCSRSQRPRASFNVK